MTDKDRHPKPALSAVEHIYKSDRYDIRETAWPKVSVVVASYNGAETLCECLTALDSLNYPDYEVILIDDGSTDHTADLAKAHPNTRYIGVPNGGLSNARNLGIKAAEGEIVAFIDSDAYPHPDWLYFLVTTMEEKKAMAVGGPNLLPPNDGFTAQCVDFAPGNPTHVLIDNELAEHVPGCNMAFRKDALEEIGLFDPTHRAAGDDVDVCWKLLVRDRRIAFSPCAIVWHHRRPTVRKFLKQQMGYGYAEAHLQRRYPGRFNIFGDLVWRGGIYDSPHSAMKSLGIPKLFRPSIYYGKYGGGMFQSIYQPFMNWWFQIFTAAEWQSLTWCMAGAGIVAMVAGVAVSGWVLTALAFIMFGATLGAAAVPAVHAASQKRWKGWKGWQRLKSTLTVSVLHIIQPLARAWGRVKGTWASRHHDGEVGHDMRIWGNMSQRHEWLDSLQNHLHACGWLGQEGDDWDESDIEVTGPGPYKVKLISTCEEILEKGRHYVHYRVWTKAKRIVPILWGIIGATIPAFVLFPFLLPLAVPVLVVVWCLANARRNMRSALSHLALEVAEAKNMPRVGEDW